jgi:hypothetical protein
VERQTVGSNNEFPWWLILRVTEMEVCIGHVKLGNFIITRGKQNRLIHRESIEALLHRPAMNGPVKIVTQNPP